MYDLRERERAQRHSSGFKSSQPLSDSWMVPTLTLSPPEEGIREGRPRALSSPIIPSFRQQTQQTELGHRPALDVCTQHSLTNFSTSHDPGMPASPQTTLSSPYTSPNPEQTDSASPLSHFGNFDFSHAAHVGHGQADVQYWVQQSYSAASETVANQVQGLTIENNASPSPYPSNSPISPQFRTEDGSNVDIFGPVILTEPSSPASAAGSGWDYYSFGSPNSEQYLGNSADSLQDGLGWTEFSDSDAYEDDQSFADDVSTPDPDGQQNFQESPDSSAPAGTAVAGGRRAGRLRPIPAHLSPQDAERLVARRRSNRESQARRRANLASSQAVGQTSDTPQTQIEELQNQKAALEHENSDLRDTISSLEVSHTETMREKDNLRARLEAMEDFFRQLSMPKAMAGNGSLPGYSDQDNARGSSTFPLFSL